MRLPYFTQYTDRVAYGDSYMFRVRINPKHKDNLGLELHEYQHIKQWYRWLSLGISISTIVFLLGFPTLGVLGAIFSLQLQGTLYSWVPHFRKKMEVEAFRVQIKNTKGNHKEAFIKALMEDYDLNITKREARRLLYGIQ